MVAFVAAVAGFIAGLLVSGTFMAVVAIEYWRLRAEKRQRGQKL